MNVMDIGGGFPAYGLSERAIQILEKTRNDPLGYKVIAEPGRHFSQNTCFLATKVIGKRIKKSKTCYHLNDSLYHSFNCNLMDGVTFENDNNQFYSKMV